jgi:hypothetical protein
MRASLSGWTGLVSLMFLAPFLAGAAPSFTLSPVKQEFSLAPGQSKIGSVMITNNLGREAVFELRVEDLTPADRPEEVLALGGDGGPYSLKRYLILPRPTTEILDGQTLDLPFEINLPPETPPGGLQGAIVVTSRPVGDPAGGTQVAVALSALVFVRVEGEVSERGATVSFGPIGDWWQVGQSAVRFHFSFHNQGNVYLNPYGGIDLRPILAWGGRSAAVIEPNFVLPGSIRLREVVWQPETRCGLYAAQLNLNRGYTRPANVIDHLDSRLLICPAGAAGRLLLGLIILGLLAGLMIKLKPWSRFRA